MAKAVQIMFTNVRELIFYIDQACIACNIIIIWYFVDLQDASITNKAEVSGKEASDNADEEDRPLSTWFGGMHNPSGASELSK